MKYLLLITVLFNFVFADNIISSEKLNKNEIDKAIAEYKKVPKIKKESSFTDNIKISGSITIQHNF